jgi:hypothetical protein
MRRCLIPAAAHVLWPHQKELPQTALHRIFFIPYFPPAILIFVHVVPTIITLTLFTLAIVLLRIRWDVLPPTLKRLLVRFATGAIGLMVFAYVSRISTTFDHLNIVVYWCAVLSYIFFVVLCTRLHPIWLTSLIAIVLILPLLSASALLPLADIFSNLPHHITPIGNGYFSDVTPIDSVTKSAGGADIAIYRRLPWLPFLRRRHQGVRFFITQCDAPSAYAILQPDQHHILMACPALPGHPPSDTRGDIVPLY